MYLPVSPLKDYFAPITYAPNRPLKEGEGEGGGGANSSRHVGTDDPNSPPAGDNNGMEQPIIYRAYVHVYGNGSDGALAGDDTSVVSRVSENVL